MGNYATSSERSTISQKISFLISLIVFRKFLMGQCSKIIHLKEPFKGMGMSTKRIFDDMYLFLKEVNMNYNKNMGNIDEMNGLPAQTYYETTSQFWNLIYKSS